MVHICVRSNVTNSIDNYCVLCVCVVCINTVYLGLYLTCAFCISSLVYYVCTSSSVLLIFTGKSNNYQRGTG